MAAIWRTRDQFGREVTLSAEHRNHILQRHEGMAVHLGDVKLTVENPSLVARDINYRRREHFYRPCTSEQHLWIKVVVNYRPVPPQGTWAGEVITAYPVREREILEVPLQL